MRRLILEEPYSRAAIWSRRLAVFALAVAAMALGLVAGGRRRAGRRARGAWRFAGSGLSGRVLSATAAVVIWRTGRRGAGIAFVGLRPRARAARLSRFAVLAGDFPARHQRRLDRSRDAAELSALGQGAGSARRSHAAGVFAANARGATARLSESSADPRRYGSERRLSARACRRPRRAAGASSTPSRRACAKGSAISTRATDRCSSAFLDDIAIRIKPCANQTRIDIRSASRIWRHDFGANAAAHREIRRRRCRSSTQEK